MPPASVERSCKQHGLDKEVAVLLAVQDREPVPEESDRGERGAKCGHAAVLVLGRSMPNSYSMVSFKVRILATVLPN
jgi:hypothetical protein